MTKNQKTLMWIFIGLAIIIGGSVIWYFFLRDECDPLQKGYTKKGKLNDKCGSADPQKDNIPAPSGSQWVPDTSFPLKRGSWGERVKAVQKALGFTASQQDGKFGPMTENAVKAKLGTVDVSAAQYEQLINPAATGGGTNFAQVKQAFAGRSNNFSGGITTAELGKNTSYFIDYYTNGRVIINDSNKRPIKRGTYSNGGEKIVIDSADGGYSSTTSNAKATLTDIIRQIEG